MMTTKEIGGLIFTFEPGKGNKACPTKGILSVRRGEDGVPLLTDTFDIMRDQPRRKFVDKLYSDNPKINDKPAKADAIQCLIQLSDEVKNSATSAKCEDDKPAEENPFEGVTSDELREAMDMLESDNLFDRLSKDFEALGIAGETNLAKTIYLIMVSRLLKKPLAAVIQGLSSTGKSFILETIAKFMPPEAIIQAHEMSDKALYFMREGSLKHKVIVSGERVHNRHGKEGQAEDNSKAFREMTASGALSKEVVVKDGKTGEFVTRHIEQEGPIAYIESTTATQLFDEDSTRVLRLTMNETSEQTQAIMNKQREEAKLEGPGEEDRAKIIRRHHGIQRLLQYYDKERNNLSKQILPPPQIRIPFIDNIDLPSNVVSSRRTFPLLISFIRVVAFLRKFHPSKASAGGESNEGGVIEADLEDYRIAYDLIQPIIAGMYAPLPEASRGIIPMLKEKTQNTLPDGRLLPFYNVFTLSDCERWMDICNATTRRRIWPLVSAGIISCDKKTQPYKFKVIHPELANDAGGRFAIGLPKPDELYGDI